MADFAQNKKAYFDYEVLEKIEAGIELFGYEVKSVKSGKCSLVGGRVIIRGGEAFVLGLKIDPYQPNNSPEDYDPERVKRLLLSKDEIKKLENTEKTKGLTIVPLSLYNKGRVIKVSIGICRGKKKYDKRETIKKRDTERALGRTLKR
ncbi:SsrA-binding protein SmpB [Candidatus Nomurabacteria bacterium]|nr:SsrA-binding protein SmpB [Candidatus Nomurabacteria bacterium]USN94524.1 MAG: SsrA-binding protein SmpB [Candidatus Nomurabacteria bacterium]